MYAPGGYDGDRYISRFLHYNLDGICTNAIPASSLTVYFSRIGMLSNKGADDIKGVELATSR